MGLTVPLYSVHAITEPWHPVWDTSAAACCLLGAHACTCRSGPCCTDIVRSMHMCRHAAPRTGIWIAAVADNQLHAFTEANEQRRAAGRKPVLLLDTGEATRVPAFWPVALPAGSSMASCMHACRPMEVCQASQLLWGAALLVGAGQLCGHRGTALGAGGSGIQQRMHGRSDAAHGGAHAAEGGARRGLQGVPAYNLCLGALVCRKIIVLMRLPALFIQRPVASAGKIVPHGSYKDIQAGSEIATTIAGTHIDSISGCSLQTSQSCSSPPR